MNRKSGSNQRAKGTSEEKTNLRNGDPCEVTGGTHAGKSGIVRDMNVSKGGNVTLTVVQENGDRFKTLAKNVVLKGRTA